MKARPNMRFANAVITSTRIDLTTTDATEAPAIEVAEVSLTAFDQTPEYTTREPVLLPAGKTKRTWRWSLLGANTWRITAGDKVIFVQTTPAGVVRLDEESTLAILRDGFARELGYSSYQTWQDETAAYQLARETANREARG